MTCTTVSVVLRSLATMVQGEGTSEHRNAHHHSVCLTKLGGHPSCSMAGTPARLVGLVKRSVQRIHVLVAMCKNNNQLMSGTLLTW